MASRFVLPFADVGSGITPSSGAKLEFFATDTSTPKDTYSDLATTTPNSNPVIADSTGVFSDIFIEGAYKVVLKDSNNVQIWEADPVQGIISSTVTETITTLKALTGQADGEAVTLLGHTDRGKGGGIFYFDSSSAATDNNGTIIQPDVGSGRWLRDDDGPMNVMWFGALGDWDGATGADDTAEIQAAIDTGDHVYFPSTDGEQYLISSTLSVLAEVSGGRIRESFRMTADVSNRDAAHLIQVATGSAIEAVIQVLDGVSANAILTNCSFVNISIDGNDEAVFGLACGKWNSSINQLVKMFHTENLSIRSCRIGYIIGGAAPGIETDSAGYSNINTVIEHCPDHALFVDTGNGAAIGFSGPTFNNNGWNPTTDSFNTSGVGCNMRATGGQINFFAGTSAGNTDRQPATADIVANSSDIRINGWWSDTWGPFLIEAGGADSAFYINGLRHTEGGMHTSITNLTQAASMVATIGSHVFIVGSNISLQDVVGMTEVNGNTYAVTATTSTTITLNVNSTGFTPYTSGGLATVTPVSIRHVCKMNLMGCLLEGRIESNEGVGGCITNIGCNYVSGGAAGSNATAYEGTLKTNQKGIVSINNFGNRAQLAIGGGTVDMAHKGAFTPQFLGIGASNSATGPTCVSQTLGPASTDSGHTEYLDETTGTKTIYINCFKSDTAGLVAPILNAKDCHIIDIGGGSFNAFTIRRHKFTNDTPVAQSTFVEMFQVRQGVLDGTLDEVAIAFPHNASNPNAVGGQADYWEGCIYYNTTSDKLVVNTSGTTWETITSA